MKDSLRKSELAAERTRVTQFFARLHGRLQQEEEAVHKAVTAICDRNPHEMAAFEEVLAAQIKVCYEIIKSSEICRCFRLEFRSIFHMCVEHYL